MEDLDPNYKAVFDKGAALVKNSIQLDKQTLEKLGFFEKRRLKRALIYFEKASSLAPTNGAPMLFIAKIKQRFGEFGSSLEWLKKANSVEPNNLILAIETSAALGRLEKHKEAATVLENASKSHPEDPRIWSNLGLSYLMAEETNSAVKTFEYLVQIEPDFPLNRKLFDLASKVALGEKPTPRNEAELLKMI